MLLHWSGDLQDTCNLVLLTKLVNCILVTVKRGALGFLILQFWLIFRMGFRFLCQKTPVFSVLVFIVLCTGFWFFFKLAFGFGLS